ncbi:hypothetical protein E4T44_00613 [Aureobasidium sp. EXF-8845]|nr:hypothetical protein E4T44_00613 [Aureobasidium sp. EXF-8845]KAI4856716.1 hypothetical protein E4T45_01812 [Aureobasidium sp. EXF-8846]
MAFKPTSSRTFFRTLRNLVREAHPFARNTATLLPHAHDNSLLVRRTFRTAAAFVPFYVTVLGWPWMAASVLKRTGI